MQIEPFNPEVANHRLVTNKTIIYDVTDIDE